MEQHIGYTRTLLVSAALLLLQACGGGSGDKEPSTATTSSSASLVASSTTSFSTSTTSSSSTTSTAPASSASSSSSSVPVTSLTISGMLVAEALANAPVEVSVGTQTFSALADAQQKYQVTLNVSDANKAAPIFITAQGLDSNNWVKLASLLPSITRAKTLAGADNILDSAEFIGVNLSPMSTAEYALAKEFKATLVNDAERQAALLNISAQRQLDSASTLTLLLTDIDYNLPTSTATTLDFLLDANASSSYINIFKSRGTSKTNFLTEYSEAILTDKNQLKATSILFDDTYLVESDDSYLVLNMNKNGTGSLHTNRNPSSFNIDPSTSMVAKDIPFNWVKKGNKVQLSFAAPINYGQTYESCTFSYVSYTNVCTRSSVKLIDISLTLLSENDVNTLVTVTRNTATITSAGVQTDSVNTSYANLKKSSAYYPITANELLNREWYLGDSRYVFNADASVAQTNLLTQELKTLPWNIENNQLNINNGEIELLFTNPHEAGFSIKAASANNPGKLMVERKPVTMTASDWAGRWVVEKGWLDGRGFYDYMADGKFRDGFDVDLNSAWTVLNPTTSFAQETGSYNWGNSRDVLAIMGGRYYYILCGKRDQSVAIPSYCELEVATIDKTFSGNYLWANWSDGLFQDQNNTLWNFAAGELNIGGSAISHTKVANNAFYLPASDQVLELLSSSTSSATLCRYKAFSDCSHGEQITLTRGIDIGTSYATTGGFIARQVIHADPAGYTSYSFHSIENGLTIPNNAAITLGVFAQSDYKLDTISGCDGVLNGTYYTIPARTTTCNISLSFAPL